MKVVIYKIDEGEWYIGTANPNGFGVTAILGTSGKFECPVRYSKVFRNRNEAEAHAKSKGWNIQVETFGH